MEDKNKIDLYKLFPILMDLPDEDITITPSIYNKEMSMTTEERFEKMMRPTRKFRLHKKGNTFSRTPDVVIFQNWTPGVYYTTTLSLMNLHTVSKYLKLVGSNIPNFKITTAQNSSTSKVAPGMQYILNIRFYSLEIHDIRHEISFETENGSFSVQIFAITYRPILHIPDEIHLPDVPAKMQSEKSLIVSNRGKVPCRFVLKADHPFSAVRDRLNLEPNKSAQITLNCLSLHSGFVCKKLLLIHEDEIVLFVKLSCNITTLFITLMPNVVQLDDTYMKLKNFKEIIVNNHSNHTASFQFKLNSCLKEDNLQALKTKERLIQMKEFESKRSTKLETMDIVSFEEHGKIYERICKDELECFEQNEKYLYKHANFEILPLEGVIHSHSTKTFQIIFAPDKKQYFESCAYLDVTGRDDRIPVKFTGIGLGPLINFNVKTLIVNDIYIRTAYMYEVIAINSGNIQGTIKYCKKPSEFGGRIYCEPYKTVVPLDSQKILALNFETDVQGKFVEHIEYVVLDSNEVLLLSFEGNAVCPYLNISVEELDFGILSFEMEVSKEIELINNTSTTISFTWFIPENDDVLEVNWLMNNDKSSKDVSLKVDCTSIRPEETVRAQVIIKACVEKQTSTRLMLFMYGEVKNLQTLPIKYECKCPDVICEPREFSMPFCFIKDTFITHMKLINKSSISGYISLINKEQPRCIDYVVMFEDGLIGPFEEIDVEIHVTPILKGRHLETIQFQVAGRCEELNTKFLLLCDAQGPVITKSPENIDFDEMELLSPVIKKLMLRNESPLTAVIKTSIYPEQVFEIDTSTIEIPSNEVATINVRGYAEVLGKYRSVITINVENSSTLTVVVTGRGYGTSILCEPKITPSLDFGELFTCQQLLFPIKFSNLGNNNRKLLLTRQQNIISLKDVDKIPGSFKFVPRIFELAPDEQTTINVMVYSRRAKKVVEDYYCFENEGRKLTISMSFMFLANFVEPTVLISKQSLHFFVKHGIDVHEEHTIDEVTITNPLNLQLKIGLKLSKQFFIILKEKRINFTSITLDPGGSVNLKILFVTPLHTKRCLRVNGHMTIDYINHPKADSLNLIGDIFYPTVNLCPPLIDFKCIPLGSHTYDVIVLQNVSPLSVYYKWEFLETDFELESMISEENSTAEEETRSDISRKIAINIDDYCQCDMSESVLTLFKVYDKPESNGSQAAHKIEEEVREIMIKERMRNILFPLISRFAIKNYDEKLLKVLSNAPPVDSTHVSQIFSIEPYEGWLEPYESVITNIGFFPPANKKIKAKAICQVLGSEHEILSLRGSSSIIKYMLNTRLVDFGRQLILTESSPEIVTLTNTGESVFSYMVKLTDRCKRNSCLRITPTSGVLQVNETVEIKITFFVSKADEFKEWFYINIGYLEPIKINVHGFGVFCQLYLFVPKAHAPDGILMSYKALATITEEYLYSLKGFENIPSYNPSKIKSDYVFRNVVDFLEREGWVVITDNDIYPNEMEIHLAEERQLAQQAIKRATYFRGDARTGIGKFYTTPYIVDFGYVTRGSLSYYTVLVLNYGPVRAFINITVDKAEFLLFGMQAHFKGKYLDVGQMSQILIIFKPPDKKFNKEFHTFISSSLFVSVNNGSIIPVHIKAIVTSPIVSIQHNSIDFGKVKVGDCLRKSILITNNGYVESHWSVILRSRKVEHIVELFHIEPSQGILQPGKKELLNIYFEPTLSKCQYCDLVVTIEGNPKSIIVKLCGYGLQPTIVLSEHDLNFPPKLPYSKNNQLFLTVQNISTFPVEYYFKDYDEDRCEEEKILGKFMEYFKLKKIYLPRKSIRSGLHEMFFNFINALEQLKEIEEQEQMKLANRLKVSVKPQSEEGKGSESNVVTSSNEENTQIIPASILSPEISDIKKDNFENIVEFTKHAVTRIFNDTAIVVSGKKSHYPRDERCGILLVLHGGPQTNFCKAALAAGKAFNMPVYNIDRLIVEALLENKSEAAKEVNKKISDSFDKIASDSDLIQSIDEDAFETLWKKITLILSGKVKKNREKGKSVLHKSLENSSRKSRSNSWPGSSRSDKRKETDTFMNISVDVFCDVLSPKLENFSELIIESLNSTFFKKPSVTLSVLLSAVGNLKYIYFFLFSYTYQNYINFEKMKMSKEKEPVSNTKSDKLDALIDMEYDEFEQLDECDKQIFYNYIAKRRKPNKKEDVISGTVASEKGSARSTKTDKAKAVKSVAPPFIKSVKDEFDKFEQFQTEYLSIMEYWDRKNCKISKNMWNRRRSTKRNPSTTSDSLLMEDLDLGIPCWVISDANKQKPLDFSKILIEMFINTSQIKDAITDVKSTNAPNTVLAESTVLYSVIEIPIFSEKIESSAFTIFDSDNFQKASDSDMFVVSKNPSKEQNQWAAIPKKQKKVKKFILPAVEFVDEVVEKPNEIPKLFTPRQMLEPGEMKQYKIVYSPVTLGIHKTTFVIAISGTKLSNYFTCTSLCTIPNIDHDPHEMFTKTIDTCRGDTVLDEATYVIDQERFHFGTVIPLFPNDARAIVKTCLFQFRNITTLTCEITCGLIEPTHDFACSPENMTLLPKEKRSLEIYIRPSSVGQKKAKLFISIKNNPKLRIINLSITACGIEVEVQPTTIEFDRVVVNRNEKRLLTIRNYMPIDMGWNLSNYAWTNKIIRISRVEAIVEAYGSSDITFMFSPSVETSLFKKTIELAWFDVTTHEKLGPSQNITFLVEAFEINVDYKESLNIGTVKGHSTEKITYSMTNRAKYPVNVIFSDVESKHQKWEAKIRKLFRINPVTASLPPGKQFNFQIIFTTKGILEFKDCALFHVKFMSLSNNEECVIKTYYLKATATVYVSSFELCPSTEMHFGYQKLQTSVCQTLTVKNTGKFRFVYTILNYKKEQENQFKKQKSKKNILDDVFSAKSNLSAKSASQKSKVRRSKSSQSSDTMLKKVGALQLGPFTVYQPAGSMQPNETKEIIVEAKATAQATFEETLLFQVTQPSDVDKKGRQLLLRISGAEPFLDKTDYKTIFKNYYIVHDVSDFPFPEKIGMHSMFIISEKRFYFKKVCINSTEAIKYFFENVGRVTAVLSVKILNNEKFFIASPTTLEIIPNCIEAIDIKFTPKAIEKYFTTLQISYNNLSDNTFNIDICGEGCVPEIRLIEPKFDEDQPRLIELQPTLVNQCAFRDISFINSGYIPCKAIIEILNDKDGYFTLIPKEVTKPLLNINSEDYKFPHTTLVNLAQYDKAEFQLQFKPLARGLFDIQVKIYIINNIFETIEFHVTSQSHFQTVTLEGLDTVPLSSTKSAQSTEISVPQDRLFGYQINLGRTGINKMEKKCFVIRNDSLIDIYKFEFNIIEDAVIIPKVGHLKPNSHKLIVFSYQSEEPVNFEMKKLFCVLNKIVYTFDHETLLSWDDRQVIPEWKEFVVESGECTLDSYAEIEEDADSEERQLIIKNYSDRSEPTHTIIPDTTEEIPMFLNIIVDYAKFKCDPITVINFPGTYVNETSTETFNVENTGEIPFEINWCFVTEDLAADEVINEPTYLPSETRIYPTCVSLTSLSTNETKESYQESERKRNEISNIFTFEPQTVTIQPNETKQFIIRCEPESNYMYTVCAKGNINLVSENDQEINLTLIVKGVSPIYYFTLEKSNYVSRRSMSLYNFEDVTFSNPHIVEFESIEVKTSSTKKIDLTNSSSNDFSFEFVSLLNEPRLSCLNILTPNGHLAKGKLCKLVFSFTPHDEGVFENHFLFKIPDFNIKTPFMLVGTAREPNVYFEKVHLELQPTILGTEITTPLVLKNDESYDVLFRVLNDIPNNVGETAISPMGGEIKPKSSEIITLRFKPIRAGSETFSVKCLIRKRKYPIAIHITTLCVEVEPKIMYYSKEGQHITLKPNQCNVIDYGVVTINKPEVLKFTIVNEGNVGFYYKWIMDSTHDRSFSISLDKKENYLSKKCDDVIKLTLDAKKKEILKRYKIKVQISFGPIYTIHINANAKKLLYVFSFVSYDFGACLIQKGVTQLYSTKLKVLNQNNCIVLVENATSTTDHFTVNFRCKKLKPGNHFFIPIYFHPQSDEKYFMDMVLKFNSIEYSIPIAGEGVKLELQLDRDSSVVDLGPVTVGQMKKEFVRVCNRTPIAVTFLFNIYERLPCAVHVEEKCDVTFKIPDILTSPEGSGFDNEKKKRKTSINYSKLEEQFKMLHVSQAAGGSNSDEQQRLKLIRDSLVVKPNQVKIESKRCARVSFEFLPKEHLGEFAEKIYYQVNNEVESFCVVRGYCVGPKYSIDKNHLCFGNVIIGSSYTLYVVLNNDGDTTGKFQWSLIDNREFFTISPMNGVILSKNALRISFTLGSKKLNCFLKSKARCTIDNLDEPLEVVLVGSIIPIPAALETIYFSCPVRTVEDKTIQISNHTNEIWISNPELNSENFSVQETIKVLPQTYYPLHIKYHPVQMTNQQVHKAKLFIPLPEGQGFLYDLEGTSLPPLPADKIVRNISCKSSFKETLTLKNWLNSAQCFTVKTELVTPLSRKILYTLYGTDFFELPPMATTTYEWKIYVLNEIDLKFNVYFTNDETKEYLFFEIDLKVGPSEPLDTIELRTCVRQPIEHMLKLKNPINKSVYYLMDTKAPSLHFKKIVEMKQYTVMNFPITFNPLKSNWSGWYTFEATCEDLGVFKYNLHLTALPPIYEMPIKIKTALGDKSSATIVILDQKNNISVPHFAIKFDNSTFYHDKLNSEPGKISVIFDPNHVGIENGNVFVTSDTTGEYIYPMIGECSVPKPKGPYSIKPGSSINITFTNPFTQPQEFKYTIDSPIFHLKNNSDVIKPKKSTKITVLMVTEANLPPDLIKGVPISSRLIVTSEPGNTNTDSKWIFYLTSDI